MDENTLIPLDIALFDEDRLFSAKGPKNAVCRKKKKDNKKTEKKRTMPNFLKTKPKNGRKSMARKTARSPKGACLPAKLQRQARLPSLRPLFLCLFCIATLSCSYLKGNGLQKINIKIDKYPLVVEVAANQKSRNRGLMFREALPENAGMIFVWPKADYRSFWMKNTLIPLDIAFFDEDRFLINIHTMQPDDGSGNYGDYRSAEPAKYAIEVNAGWYEKHGIQKYSRLYLPHPINAEN